jgi:hypothetical protein
VDLAALRHERARRRGHAMTAHLRTELYERSRQAIYPVGSGAERPVDVAQNEANTLSGREALEVRAPDQGAPEESD